MLSYQLKTLSSASLRSFHRAVGITKNQNLFRWAVIREHNKQRVIEELKSSDSLPSDILSNKKLIIVTGLEGSCILRRDLTLPLTSERILRRALPFQLEPLVPFPLQDSIVFPQYDQTEKETHVTLWATTQENLKLHLNEWQSTGLDPDQISTEALALARWARFCFPKQPQMTIVYKNLGVAIDQNRIVCAMHSPDSLRLKLFLKQKYPLFQQIEQGPSEELWDFAIEVGLALEPFEKSCCQLRTSTVSTRQKKREHLILKTTLALGVATILLTIGGGHAIFHFQKQKLRNQIALYHPQASSSLEKAVSELRQKVIEQTKTTPAVPSFPTIQETLAWLSTLHTSADIHHVEYRLATYPKDKGKNTPYSAQVTIEFQAGNANEANLFTQQLQQTPSFVESTHELKWTSHPQGYTISFPLQKSF